MVRKFLLNFEFVLFGLLQVIGLESAIVGIFPALAQSPPSSETAHASEPALNDPNIVQDFMVSLPPSDPIPRQYHYFDQGTMRTEATDRPEQEAYYQLRQSVTAHRFLTNKGRGRREMRAILLRASKGFAQECNAKGGTLEPHNSNFHALTRANIRPRSSLNSLEICMRGESQSLGALLIETAKKTYDDHDANSHSIIAFHPEVVVTQTWLDAQAERQATADRGRQAKLEQERVEVERWRAGIKPGSETGCGPVLRVNGDLIEVAYYQTREPKWFRRTELSPTLYNLSGLRTCN